MKKKNLGAGVRPDHETLQGVIFFNSSESVFWVKNGGWFFVTQRGGGVRGGLTFVTKKVVFLNEGFPNAFSPHMTSL